VITSSPRTLFLTPGCFDKGGISRYSRYQIDALRAILGPDRVRVLSLLGPGEGGFETPFAVDWHGPGPAPTRLSRAAFAAQALRHALLWRPQVIHCAHVNFTPLVTRLAALCGATTVLNVYGLELWSGLSPARRAHLARMDHVIADCHATAAHVTAEALHPRPPAVIWDCADLDRFHPGPVPAGLATRYGLPDPAQHRLVLTLGRLSVSARHKGYDRLLDIFGAVRAQMPAAHLVIAGRGDDAERLRARAAELGLADCTTFTGPVDESDLPALYRAAHVFALVSDKGPGRGEGIPLTPIEAMAAGAPVLVGDEDGSPEAVDGGRNGTVVSPRDPAAMTAALVALLAEDGPAHAARRAQARAVAEERFGYTAFADKHRAFYAGLARG
jgi:phosphatidylinositol alpha-1,6-mannosyltransferase